MTAILKMVNGKIRYNGREYDVVHNVGHDNSGLYHTLSMKTKRDEGIHVRGKTLAEVVNAFKQAIDAKTRKI